MTWLENGNLVNAILSMDAYNRGYDAGIEFYTPDQTLDKEIGGVVIRLQSDIDADTEGVDAGFYALSYDLGDGQTIISYRGTDQPPSVADAIGISDLIGLFAYPSFAVTDLTVKLANNIDSILTPDVWNGWFVAGGQEESAQALLAIEFYKDVVGGLDNVYTANISTTGHSLGGGLAGLVSGLYGQEATVFDNMPYEASLQDIRDRALNPQNANDQTLREAVYGSNNINVDSVNDSNHNLFSIEDEALSSIRGNTLFGLLTTSTIPETSFTLGSSFDSSLLSDVDLHSQSLLVMRLFFSQEDGLPQAGSWDAASQYLWPTLFDDNFAHSIGFNTVNDSVIGGQDLTNERYAGILRQTLAYSAIDEGTLVFGDTGIRALYDDANDLGAALTASTNSQFTTYATVISQAFVQFAGTLALKKIEKDNFADALNGVLKHSIDPNNETLTVNFAGELWTKANGDTVLSNIVSRDTMINGLLFSDPDPEKTAQFKGYMQQLWGDDTSNVIDRVVFSLIHSGTTYLETNHDADAKTTLFVGGTNVGAQTVIGSNADDFILGSVDSDTLHGQEGDDLLVGGGSVDILWGNKGDDILDGGDGGDFLYGGEANDILIGGAGDDILNGGTGFLNADGRNLLRGGSGNDTLQKGVIDYSQDISAVSVDLYANTATDGWGDTDTLSSVEGILLSDFNDTLMLRDWDYLKYGADGGLGTDTLILSGSIDAFYQNIDGIIANENSYQHPHSLGSVFTNFETVSFDWGLTSSLRMYAEQGTFDYSTLLTNAPDDIVDLDYTMASGSLTFNYQSDALHVSGAGLSNTYSTSYISSVEGNYADNTYNISSLNDDLDLYTGKGNDIVNQTGESEDDSLAIYYRGGNDTYNIGNGITSIVLARDIQLSDLTLGVLDNQSDNKFSIDIGITGGGSIDINYDSSIQSNDSFLLHAVDGYIEFSSLYSQNDAFWTSQTTFTSGSSPSYFSLATEEGDHLIGSGGEENTLLGYGGDDILEGKELDDHLLGGSGNDLILGGDGEDTIYGGDGYDHLYGEGGIDNIYGGNGDDRLYSSDTPGYIEFNQWQRELLDGGEGSDTAVFSGIRADYSVYAFREEYLVYNYSVNSIVGRLSDIEFIEFSDETIDLADEVITGTNNSDTLSTNKISRVELIGGDGNDTLTGGSGHDIIIGGFGDDILNGGNGNDTIYGGYGNDTIRGGGYDDTIYGGHGDDIIYIGNTSVDLEHIHGGEGSDTFVVENFGGFSNTYSLFTIIEDFDVTQDKLDFTTSWDTVYNLGDLQYTDEGDDLVIHLEDGEDSGIYFNFRLSGISFSDLSIDNFELKEEPPQPPFSLPPEPFSLLEGTDDPDTLISSESFGEAIFGYDGDDTLYGFIGDDYLIGDDGDDLLYGDDGNDVLISGSGADTMEGGFGDDYYLILVDQDFSDGELDHITEVQGTDTLVLEGDFTASDVVFIRNGDDLSVYVDGWDDIWGGITIHDQFYTLGEYDTTVENIAINNVLYDLNDSFFNGFDNGVNDAPIAGSMSGYLSFQTGSTISFLSDFIDPEGDTLTYTASMQDGSDLPSFILFDPTTGNLSGTAPSESTDERFLVRITASDGEFQVSHDLNILIYDLILGTGGIDVIHGAGGTDYIYGRDGDDILYGEEGNDRLLGENGNDALYGNDGDDTLYGNDGDDTLWGLEGNDIILGGNGNDVISGGGSSESGRNFLYGDAGNDVISGGAGDDYLTGGLDTDTFVFEDGFGNDTVFDFVTGEVLNLSAISSVTQFSDLIISVSGADSLITVGSQGSILVKNVADTYWTANDFIFANVQAITGTSGDDTIYGTSVGETIYGLGGHDYIVGEDGDDEIYGGDGDDYLYGNGGTDTIYGEGGDDRISGHAESDTLYGGDGVDRIYGYENSDLIYGGSGSDKIYGDDQDGLDTYTLGGADEIHGEEGNDQIFAGVGDDIVYGDAGDDDIYGHAGHDTIYGGSNNDRLYGGDGNDTFYGGDDSDTVWGGNGDDIIIGGNGRDYLNGEAGADTFYLDLDEVDRVRDFEQSEGDKINISDLLDGYNSATDDVNNFVDIVIRSNTRTDIRVDEDGQGGNFQYVGIVYGDLTGETVDSLVASGALIVE